MVGGSGLNYKDRRDGYILDSVLFIRTVSSLTTLATRA
jgi:hypothetical protein